MRKLFLTSMAVVAVAWAAETQARTIRGTIVEAGTNEPLIGATVMPIGGGQGVAADLDGHFTLNVPDNVKKAKVSYVGYKEQTVDLSDGMVVHLASSTSNLDEVVVVAYGTATKESLTGSVSVVGAKEIEDRPVTSVTAALEGNAPGVQVNNTTGQPGSSPSIRIRGFGSITGTQAPTYVVDGMPFEGDLADINPADIESLTVLKDAASCALYGVRGANGVILITTKRAKNVGKVDVTLTVREGSVTRGLSEYKRLSTTPWMETMFNSYANQLMEVNPGAYPTRQDAYAYLQSNFVSGQLQGQNVYDLPGDQLFNADGKVVGNVLPGYTDLNWWDAVHHTGFRQEYNLNVAGATEKYNVFGSIGYLKEQGYLLRTDFERFNGRFNLNANPTSYLRLGMDLRGSATSGNTNANANSTSMENPFATMYYAPIFPYYAHDAEGNIIYENGAPAWNLRGRNDNRNVAFTLRHDKNDYHNLVVDGGAYATAVIPYGFELTVRGQMSRNFTRLSQYQNNLLGDAYPDGRLIVEDDQYRYHTFIQNLTWGHNYGKDQEHHIDVLLAHENTTSYSSYENISMTGQVEDDYYAPDNFVDITALPSGGYGESRMESYLGRARYNYWDKYFFEASLRRDGSDRFSKDNRWGTFWSVGASWIITKESFTHSLDWLNYLKFRFAYGAVGNYLSAPTRSWASQYAYITALSNQAMLLRATSGNPNLKWEANKTLDLGLEGSLFGNRLNFTIGYFDKRSSDMIFSLPTAPSMGYIIGSGSSMKTPINLGELANRGWELSFNGTIMRNKDLLWTASIDATFLTNRINKLPYNNADMNNGYQRFSVGKSLYEWYAPEFIGVDQLTGKSLYAFDEQEYKYYYASGTGNYTDDQLKEMWQTEVNNAADAGELVTINGKTYTTSATYATKGWRGSAVPTVYGSFGTQLSWKGINFGLLFTYSLGGKVMDSSYQRLMSVNDMTSNYHIDALKAWQEAPAGMTEDSPYRIDPNGVPVNNGLQTQDNNATSTRFLTSASYLVLKNIMISYDLPRNWVSKLQLQNINLGFTIDNLFTVTARKGLNPQQTFSGVQDDNGGFVTTRVFSFQLTARF
ncbi:MAG: SusC/RagA family TonB-linked outer membrane protein [Bacteroidales bacterium]|nr:SusC/RagA family TonB-linked outer membrane protein [Bacteroidales bacterium]